ncbi:MAG: aspartyl protease family protein [Thermoanaerobaculia bacterium]
MNHSRMFLVAAFLAAVAQQAAAAPPSALSVVDCWARALGGRERIEAVRGVERNGVVETGGMKGTVRSWSTASGAVRTDVKLGPYESTDAFDGKQGWTKTGSAPAHDLTDADLARIVSDGYLESLSVFFTDRMNGRVELAASDGDSSIVITPEGGRPMTLRFDAATCLPRSIEQPERDRTLRVEILEWVEAEGVRFAKRLRQSTGDPAYDVVITWESVHVNPDIAAAQFAVEASEETGITWNGRASAKTKLELTQNHPYVPVFVNGKGPSMFILDTGADMTVIERGHAAELGLPMEGSIEIRGAGSGKLDAALIASPKVTIAGLDVPTEAVIAIPLDALSRYEGRAIEGILGYDVLSRFVVEIDYAANAVTFHDPASFRDPKDARAFDIYFDGNSPVMRGTVALPDGRSFDARLTLDTGNRTALILHQPFVEAHAIRKSLPVLADAPLGMGVGGMTRQDIGRIASLTLGGFVMNAPLTSFTVDKGGANANPDLDGNIGGEVLRRFTLWVDYGRKRILLHPNDELGTPFEHDMSGLTLAYGEQGAKQPVVVSVLPGSPAEAAGLKVGDLLVAVDGVATSATSLESLRETLRTPERKLRLEAHRGKARIEVELKTRRMI